jgi:Tol biopolymer transport system component
MLRARKSESRMSATGANRELDFLNQQEVQGERLSQRLASAELVPEELLRLAIQAGSLLRTAHQRGSVHGRICPAAFVISGDHLHLLRPENVEASLAAPYRAPEIVQGQTASPRSDTYSYGATLYALVSRRRPFEGSGAELDQSIVHDQAPALNAKTLVFAAMEGVIAGCMQKAPGARRQRIQNAVIELKLAGKVDAHRERLTRPRPKQESTPRAEFRPVPQTRRDVAIAVLAVIAVAAVTLAAVQYFARPRVQRDAMAFTVQPPEPRGLCGAPAISPDGRNLACTVPSANGQAALWVRALSEPKWMRMGGTEGAFAPFWSPDGQSIAFFSGGSLKRIALSGPGEKPHEPTILCEAVGGASGGAWSAQGTIVFADAQEAALFRMSSTGGKPLSMMAPDRKRSEAAFLWPQFLPDGKHFIFYVQTTDRRTSGIAVASVDSPGHKLLIQSDSNGVFSVEPGEENGRPGYILFVQDRDLRKVRFDYRKLTVTGDSVAVVPEIGHVGSLSLAPLSVSSNGILAYQPVGTPTRQIAWVDRTGRVLRNAGDGDWGPPRLAPDGIRAVAGKRGADGRNEDLWLFGQNGATTQLLSVPGVSEASPAWSADGQSIVYASNRSGVYDLFIRTLDGRESSLLVSKDAKYPHEMTPDGQFVLFDAIGQGTQSDIWAYSMRDNRAVPIVQTIFDERFGAVSPDGKWMAYQSAETGRYEVYVQPFGPASSEKRAVRVSASGGTVPRWRRDGGELFFLSREGHMMSAVPHPANGKFEYETPKSLFPTRASRISSVIFVSNFFDTVDGQKFFINLPEERPATTSAEITIVTNWFEKLK